MGPKAQRILAGIREYVETDGQYDDDGWADEDVAELADAVGLTASRLTEQATCYYTILSADPDVIVEDGDKVPVRVLSRFLEVVDAHLAALKAKRERRYGH